MSRALIRDLVRSLEASADWARGSAEAREFGWRGGRCWCDGSKRHTAACRRARTVHRRATEFLSARGKS